LGYSCASLERVDCSTSQLIVLFSLCRHIHDDVDEQWDDYDLNKDELISWKEYKQQKREEGENTYLENYLSASNF